MTVKGKVWKAMQADRSNEINNNKTCVNSQ